MNAVKAGTKVSHSNSGHQKGEGPDHAAEAVDARRQDMITVLGLRNERAFTLTNTMRVRGFFDLFELTNSNAAETVTTGANFLRPTAILAPRTARVGTRFGW